MHNLKDKSYEQFTPIERINLTMAALARGDIEEADRCWETCPRHDYKALDFDYTIRINAAMMLRMEFREKCFHHYNQIKLIEAHMLHLECFIDSEKFDEKMDKLVNIHSIHIARLKAVYDAMKLLCVDIGLFMDTLLQHCHIEENCADICSYLSSDIKADIKFIEYYKQEFSMYWQD